MSSSFNGRPLSNGLDPNSSTRALFNNRAAQFSLATFSNRDFVVKDFIEALSESAVPATRKSGTTSQAFDPRPLIRTFENALARLSEISADLEGRETELSAAVRRAEAQHNSAVQNLGRRFDDAVRKFHELDESLTGSTYDDGGTSAVQIGEKLEELDRRRVRAQDAEFLIQCWLEASEKGELFTLEEMRRQSSGEKKMKCAQISQQLLKISQRLDPGSWQTGSRAKVLSMNGTNGESDGKLKHNTREIIEKFSETLEKELLAQFDEYYRRANFEGMRDCSSVLQGFNGGASVIGTFVNQHQFFIDRNALVNEEVGGDQETWEKLADPDADSPGVESSLLTLVEEVKVVIEEESQTIKQAFTFYELVLTRFLQRVFQQSIQQRLEKVLEKANLVSTLAYLRSLQAANSCIRSMTDDLKAHGLTEHPDTLAPSTTLMLDQQFEDLFVPYLIGSSYIEREKRNLEELYTSLLFKFTVYHAKKRKTPTTFLASLAKSGSVLLASVRDAYVDRLESSELAPQQKRILLRIAGLKDADSARRHVDAEYDERHGLVDTDETKRMLKWLAEAVGRGRELSGGSENPRDIAALLELLLTHIGQVYLETALDAMYDAALTQNNSKNEPNLSYLDNLNSCIITMQLMTRFANVVLLPLAGINSVARKDMEKSAKTAITNLEDKVNALLQRTIDVVESWTSRLLSNQKKTDFREGAANMLEMLQTPTCLSVVQFLTKIHNTLLIALSPSDNLSSVLSEIATSLRSALISHFARFTVSPAGGLLVTKDVSRYNELIRGWNLDKDVQDSFQVLTEIGNIFVINPEALRERLRGKTTDASGKSTWERGDMRVYVKQREDVGSVAIQNLLSNL